MTVYINGTPLDGYQAVYNREVAAHDRVGLGSVLSESIRADQAAQIQKVSNQLELRKPAPGIVNNP